MSQSSLAVVKPVFTVAHDHSKESVPFFVPTVCCLQVHSMDLRSRNITASSPAFLQSLRESPEFSKVKFGHISSLTEPQSRSLFSFLCSNDTQQNFLRIFKHSWKTLVKKITFLNVHLLCKKHFIDCLFVSVVFQKYLKNLVAFGRTLVREIRHVLLVTKFFVRNISLTVYLYQ